MKMEEHVAYLKMLRIPYKEAVFRAFHHIFNEHKNEVNIEDLIKATCVFQRPAPSIEPVRREYGYRPRRQEYRERGYQRYPRRFRDRY